MKTTLPFTEEHEMFRAAFRKFVEKEIATFYKDWYLKDREVPIKLFK